MRCRQPSCNGHDANHLRRWWRSDQFGPGSNLNRPGGNVTGVIFTTVDVTAKRLGLLHELVPKATLIGVLQDANLPEVAVELQDAEVAAKALGLRAVSVEAVTPGELNAAFATMVQEGVGALLVGGGPLTRSSQRQRFGLAVGAHAIPTS